MSPTLPITTAGQIILLVISTLGVCLTLSVVSLRFVARYKHRRRWDYSDICIGLAEVFLILVGVDIWVAVTKGGAGLHAVDITAKYGQEPIKIFGMTLWAYQLFLQPLWCLSKLSVLALYASLMPFREMLLAVKTLAVFTGLWCLGGFFSAVFLCSPIAFGWDRSIAGGHCVQMNAFYFSNALINLVLDVIILTIPMPYFYKMRLPLRRKVLVMGLFSLGFITVGVAIARQIIILKMDPEDGTYTVIYAACLATVEAIATITVACLPFLKPLFRPSPSSTRPTDLTPIATSQRGGDTEVAPRGCSHSSRQGPWSSWGRSFKGLDSLADDTWVAGEGDKTTPGALGSGTVVDNTAWEALSAVEQGLALPAIARCAEEKRQQCPASVLGDGAVQRVS